MRGTSDDTTTTNTRRNQFAKAVWIFRRSSVSRRDTSRRFVPVARTCKGMGVVRARLLASIQGSLGVASESHIFPLPPPQTTMRKRAWNVTQHPMRLQRSRRKGARLVSPDGRAIVCCTRPNRFCNPFAPGKTVEGFCAINADDSLERYRSWIHELNQSSLRTAIVCELRFAHLACYCKLCEKHANGKPLNVACPDCKPCHVDCIGEILYGKPESDHP